MIQETPDLWSSQPDWRTHAGVWTLSGRTRPTGSSNCVSLEGCFGSPWENRAVVFPIMIPAIMRSRDWPTAGMWMFSFDLNKQSKSRLRNSASFPQSTNDSVQKGQAAENLWSVLFTLKLEVRDVTSEFRLQAWKTRSATAAKLFLALWVTPRGRQHHAKILSCLGHGSLKCFSRRQQNFWLCLKMFYLSAKRLLQF